MESVVKNFYLGELGKLILAGVSFALVFRLAKQLEAAHFFVGFMIAHLAGLVIMIRLYYTEFSK